MLDRRRADREMPVAIHVQTTACCQYKLSDERCTGRVEYHADQWVLLEMNRSGNTAATGSVGRSACRDESHGEPGHAEIEALNTPGEGVVLLFVRLVGHRLEYVLEASGILRFASAIKGSPLYLEGCSGICPTDIDERLVLLVVPWTRVGCDIFCRDLPKPSGIVIDVAFDVELWHHTSIMLQAVRYEIS